jgi:hypothetical protein
MTDSLWQPLYNASMTVSSERLPKYQRATNPPPMRLTPRDRHILEAIHAFDGMLGFSQIKRLFFTGKSQTEERLKLLYQHSYLGRPDKDQRRRLPEMIYWLDRRGAELVASLNGTTLGELGWRKEPRWFQVEHDLAVNDFRLDLMEGCKSNPDVSLESWIPESEFWAFPDTVTYSYSDHKMRRKIRPDGFFMLSTGKNRIRYLLEIDRSTEDYPRFLREKILPGLAYLNTQVYEDRFGHRSGRWLVVTTSEHRIANMLLQARRANTKGLFYFTTYDKVNPSTILLAPIWQRADRSDLVPLIYLD